MKLPCAQSLNLSLQVGWQAFPWLFQAPLQGCTDPSQLIDQGLPTVPEKLVQP